MISTIWNKALVRSLATMIMLSLLYFHATPERMEVQLCLTFYSKSGACSSTGAVKTTKRSLAATAIWPFAEKLIDLIPSSGYPFPMCFLYL